MILFSGLSPSWQKIYAFDRFDLGAVNRAKEAIQCPSGKVLNSVIAGKRLEGEVKVLTTIGGPLGRATRESLLELDIKSEFIEVQSPTRLCTTIVDQENNVTTELVQNAPEITEEEFQEYCNVYSELVKDCQYAVLLGSLPPGAPTDTYKLLMQSSDTPVIADFRGPELLEILSLKPLLIKPNLQELEMTINFKIESKSKLIDALKAMSSLGPQWILISEGAGPLTLYGEGEVFQFTPKKVQEVNPIGSGDTLSAGIAVGLDEGKNMVEAVRFGIGAATANVVSLKLIDITRSKALHYLPASPN